MMYTPLDKDLHQIRFLHLEEAPDEEHTSGCHISIASLDDCSI